MREDGSNRQSDSADAHLPIDVRELSTRVYEALRGVAGAQLSNQPRTASLNATALVHEAWLKLADSSSARGLPRVRFLEFAAVAMRNIVVDHARARRALKAGGAAAHESLIEAPDLSPSLHAVDVLAVDEALHRFANIDRRAAQVVELRYFGGASEAEAAAVLGVSRRSVQSDWAYARAWLGRELGESA